MRVLIVGAGAVGQVYGHHLALAGAQVSVLVREARGAEAQAGFTLTRIRPIGPRNTSKFLPHQIFTSALDLRDRAMDQIWVCLPTTALDPVLLGDLCDASPKATFVLLSPGHFVKASVDPILGANRTVYGMIGMLSFVSPMLGSSDPRELATPPGLAYMLSTTKLGGGNETRALSAVTALRNGGCSADYKADINEAMAISSAALMAGIASLEIAAWSFATLREPARIDHALAAMRESIAIAASVAGKPLPFYVPLLRHGLLSLATRVPRKLLPLDLETFFRLHFSKVAAQTMLLLESTRADGRRLGLTTEALSELCQLLAESRANAALPPHSALQHHEQSSSAH